MRKKCKLFRIQSQKCTETKCPFPLHMPQTRSFLWILFIRSIVMLLLLYHLYRWCIFVIINRSDEDSSYSFFGVYNVPFDSILCLFRFGRSFVHFYIICAYSISVTSFFWAYFIHNAECWIRFALVYLSFWFTFSLTFHSNEYFSWKSWSQTCIVNVSLAHSYYDFTFANAKSQRAILCLRTLNRSA